MGDASPASTNRCHACRGENFQNAKFCGHCGVHLVPNHQSSTKNRTEPAASSAHSHPFVDPLIGVVVAERYRILEQLGRGGMGVVYKVEHTRIGKLMALKLLTGELTRDSDQVKRFRREALMASKLSHPNTVQVFDFGAVDGLTYLAMEYLRGIDLGHLIAVEGPLSAVRTAKLMIQICSSVAEAHEKDIVHRDLKPENIIVMKSPAGDDIAKVLDFGLAKLRESRELADVTTRGAIVGTPYYMSPEQVQGESVDQRSDVYALGALMHVCLTGVPVFDAPSPLAVLSKQMTEPPRPPSARFPELNIPITFSQLIMRCLRKDPKERFQTAREFQTALISALRGLDQSGADLLLDDAQLRLLADRDSLAATRSEVENYERKLQRRGRLAYAAVAVVLILGALIGLRAWHAVNQPPRFLGEELEPNNKASEATSIPFGKTVRGTLGKRLDKERSDRDFYSFEVPRVRDRSSTVMALEVSAIGNMAICAWLYRAGNNSPIARYCAGNVGAPVSIPQLSLTPGTYLVAVMQDRTEYSALGKPPVYENVSDYYTVEFKRVDRTSDRELEPNGSPSSAERLAIDETRQATLSFARDEDVFCAAPSSGTVSFEISDGIETQRPISAVLQVTPMGGPGDEIPVRVHDKSANVKPTERDQLSPWRSPPVDLAHVAPACVLVTLVPNPWAPTPHPSIAPPSYYAYSVTLRAAQQ